MNRSYNVNVLTDNAVVFCCDDNYAMPFYIALESLLINRLAGTFYSVFCLVPEQFSESNLSKAKEIEHKYDNFKLNFIDVGRTFSDVKTRISHISHVTYFRFLLPELLEKYSSCLYLDVDIIVNEDLTPLFQTKLGSNLIGAVKHPLLTQRTRIKNYEIAKSSYINAGVLLFNLSQMRREQIQNKLIELIPMDFQIQDQDILNIVCSERIYFLPVRYNFMIRTLEPIESIFSRKVYGHEYAIAKSNPAIIHYANKEKPWDWSNLKLGAKWDSVYQKSIYSNTILKRRTVPLVKGIIEGNLPGIKRAVKIILAYLNIK